MKKTKIIYEPKLRVLRDVDWENMEKDLGATVHYAEIRFDKLNVSVVGIQKNEYYYITASQAQWALTVNNK